MSPMSATLQPSPRLDRIFFALSDPTRRAIVGRLAAGPATIGELAAPFPISLPAVSKHVKILERAGLVSRQVRGRQHHCDLDPGALGEARDWLGFYRDFWRSRLDELESFLDSDSRAAGTAGSQPANEQKGPSR